MASTHGELMNEWGWLETHPLCISIFSLQINEKLLGIPMKEWREIYFFQWSYAGAPIARWSNKPAVTLKLTKASSCFLFGYRRLFVGYLKSEKSNSVWIYHTRQTGICEVGVVGSNC
jgi:hypothetical protein